MTERNNLNIIQWNCNGFYKHYNEFKILLQKYSSFIICLQETKFSQLHVPNLKNFNIYHKNYLLGTIAQGGVATLINNNFSSEEFDINTSLQAVAVKVFFPIKFIICNVYLPGSSNITKNDLENLIKQFDAPFMIVGDFNCHNPLWGSNRIDNRGNIIESIINKNNLNILNNGDPTHFSLAYKSVSSIDLSIVSPILQNYFDWFVDNDLHNSDHHPIIMPLINSNNTHTLRQKFLVKKADWNLFQSSLNFNFENDFTDINEYENFITSRIIEAAKKSIPISHTNIKHKIVPWWNDEIKNLIRDRKKYLRKFKRTCSLEDYKKFVKARLDTRNLIRKCKKKSWSEYISTINSRTQPTKIFEKLRSLNGKSNSTNITSIIDGQDILIDKFKICEKLAIDFEKINSNENYSSSFLNFKLSKESNKIIIKPNINQPYNQEITIEEFDNALASCKGSSAGPDMIHYDMIKNMSITKQKIILSFFNKIYTSGKFPDNWGKSIMIPILKPGKDPKITTNYRPISLTNVLCKILERIINKRLVWFLEKNHKLNKYQSGFRKNRSTIDNLTYLESEITESFNKNQFLVSVFFDIKKAYDTAWKYKIIQEVVRMGLEGNIVKFIENFLTNRRFRVCLGNTFSSEKHMENGIPQGSVLSVSLFLILINTVTEFLPPSVKFALYCDDLVVFSSSKKISILQNKLQNALNKLLNWSSEVGLSFSFEKTNAMLFTRRRKNVHSPILKLENNYIKFVEKQKFLGITFDQKLTWTKHIDDIKAKANKSLNLLKILSHSNYGSDRKLLLRLLNLVILPILDYGGFLYSNASKTLLKKLDSILNLGTRISTGAFRTSPVESILNDAGQLNLYHRRIKHSLMYGIKVLGSKDNPVYDKIINQELCDRFKRKSITYQPCYSRIRNKLDDWNIIDNINFVDKKIQNNPPWISPHIKIELALTNFKKNENNAEFFRSHFNKLINTNYRNFEKIYTDGSVLNENSGCAFKCENVERSYHLPNYMNICTAELYAIFKAVKYAYKILHKNFVICTDSLSSLLILNQMYATHPFAIKIKEIIHKTKNDIRFLWIPSHMNIGFNERVDKLAKQSILKEVDNEIKFYYHDLKFLINKIIKEKWNEKWINIPITNKLRSIKNDSKYFKVIDDLNRKDSIIITRIRIGHTHITHSYLIEKTDQPICPCDQTYLTINHIFNDCNKFYSERINNKVNFETLKSNEVNDLRNILKFLKDINFYDRI